MDNQMNEKINGLKQELISVTELIETDLMEFKY